MRQGLRRCVVRQEGGRSSPRPALWWGHPLSLILLRMHVVGGRAAAAGAMRLPVSFRIIACLSARPRRVCRLPGADRYCEVSRKRAESFVG